MASGKIPKEKTIIGIKDLKRDELSERLYNAGIKFDDSALKPKLQANFALMELGIVTRGGTATDLLLVTVTKWCCMSAKELATELSDRKLNDEANKWKRVEALIRNEHENPGGVKVQEKVQDVGDALEQMRIKKKAGPFGAKTNTKKEAQHPEPILMNLLLTLLFGDVSNSNPKALSGCPIKPPATVIELIESIIPYKTRQNLVPDLLAPQSPTTQLLSWLSPQCDVFAPATGDMKIPGFKDSVHQFVVLRQEEKLHAAFENLMEKSSGYSRMVWHGTSISNVRSILRNGFEPSIDDHVWSAEEVIMSYDFSFLYPSHPTYNPTWSASPYNDWGALLGCEVAGGGQYFAYGAHTARIMGDPSSVIVRYVLLLPWSENT